MTTRLRVRRLVLEGFAPGERAAVVAAVEEALRARAESGAFLAGDYGRVNAGQVSAEPSAIGRAVAGAVGGDR